MTPSHELRGREKLVLDFIRKDIFVKIYVIIAALSFLAGIVAPFVKSSSSTLWNFFVAIVTMFPLYGWWLLALVALIGAALAFSGRREISLYPFVAWIVWVAVYIRTRNLAGLRDITTNGWTLGPDLDPFLFLRWAKYIVTHGSIFAIDSMRYVPVGYDTTGELVFLSYLIAWFHHVAVWFGSTSVDQSAVLFPVFMFAITVIAFFFMVRETFIRSVGGEKASIIALIASLFLSIQTSLLPRTIAGIPEKESAAFFFMFLALYFFLKAWYSKRSVMSYVFGLLSGLATAGMALVWGGYIYLFLVLGSSIFIAFILGRVDLTKIITYATWLVSSVLIMTTISTKYTVEGILTSTTTSIAVASLGIMIVDYIITRFSLSKYITRGKLAKIPPKLLSIIVAGVLGLILVTIIFGPSYALDKVHDFQRLVTQPTTDRVGVTVAENRQPYFTEWVTSFGPFIALGNLNLGITFVLFIMGSILLFWHLVSRTHLKERIILTSSYVAFLVAYMFSRYSAGSVFNGANFISGLFLLAGFFFFVGAHLYYYVKHSRSENHSVEHNEFALLLVLFLFLISIVSARGAVRLIMVLVVPASILIGFLLVMPFSSSRKYEDSRKTSMMWIFIALLISSFFAAQYMYRASAGTAQGYVPSIYTYQWQRAMAWVRDNTPTDATFSHWWDYGYWVQSIGERGTMVDGGNANVYWNHLIGRYILTGTDEHKALDILYSHNISYFLIDSTDIGKYTAFASIGSDRDYDHRSWLGTFALDPKRTFEGKNSTSYFYAGSFSLDEDISYDLNGTTIHLPGLGNKNPDMPVNVAGLGAIILQSNANGTFSQPQGIFVDVSGKQYSIPLRYLYSENTSVDYGSGLEAGIFFMPSLVQSASGTGIQQNGALLYLSNRTLHTLFARFYLFGEETPYFKLAHSEDDLAIEDLRRQGAPVGEFLYYGGVRGPIKIWHITYPKDVQFNAEYNLPDFPEGKNPWI